MKRLPAVLLCICMALIWRSFAMAEDISVVRAEGVISGAGGDARDMALESAIKNAVGSALESMMKRESIPEDPSVAQGVYANPMKYVINYRILSEGWGAPPEQAAVEREHNDQLAQPEQKVQKDRLAQDARTSGIDAGEYRMLIEVSIDASRLRAVVSEAISGKDTAYMAVKIVAITDYGVYRSILDSLERIALIKDISYGSFSRGNITLSVNTPAAGTLLERIVKEVGDDYSVALDGSQTIVIRPARETPDLKGH
ncbi:MAG: hypothetical protein AAB307_03965 [Deltaproteobacteria bacterium]